MKNKTKWTRLRAAKTQSVTQKRWKPQMKQYVNLSIFIFILRDFDQLEKYFCHARILYLVRATGHESWCFYGSSSSSISKKSLDSRRNLMWLPWHYVPASQGILPKMAVSGVDNGYSWRPAEIRKPQAIRKGAKEGLLHSIMCECGPN